MLVFLDTEFTDFIDRELISIGLITEDGKHCFYAERNDYRRDLESDFVRSEVLPHLEQTNETSYSRQGLAQSLWAWFAALPEEVQIVCDSEHDRDLLWDAFGEGLPKNLSPKRKTLSDIAETEEFQNAVSNYYAGKSHPRHHALNDARANRLGWVAFHIHQNEKSK